jgi:hypothetical protein
MAKDKRRYTPLPEVARALAALDPLHAIDPELLRRIAQEDDERRKFQEKAREFFRARSTPPAQQTISRGETPLVAAIKERHAVGDRPGKNVTWDRYCDTIRDLYDGWADRKKRTPSRGYSDRNIQRRYGMLNLSVR